MSQELVSGILEDIQARESWAQRQTVWYQMRTSGIRRRSKPYPGAADLHFPLVDTMIEKWKPFYFQQLHSTETLATFVSTDQEHQAFTTELAYHFDYKLKQRSNLEREILVAIDHMLTSGAVCVKTYWDPSKHRIQFDAVRPSHVIVPWHTRDLQDADRLVHVIPMSCAAYKAKGELYKQDPAFIARIKGRGQKPEQNGSGETEQREIREGITHSTSDDQIIVWEVYERVTEHPNKPETSATSYQEKEETPAPAVPEDLPIGAVYAGLSPDPEATAAPTIPAIVDEEPAEPRTFWRVHTISPLAPDEPIRDPIELPYDHGELPFVRFEQEITDAGHYSSRGLPEIVGAFETSLCKLWNGKHDYMDFVNRPMFSTDRDIPNAANIRAQPGQILPFGVQKVDLGAPPVSFDIEMQSTRQIAEDRVQMPDTGLTKAQDIRSPRTATEISRVAGLLNMGVDLKSRMFRKSLGEIYRQAWRILLQFDSGTAYLWQDEVKDLDINALVDAYEVLPNGSADSWNREAKLEKAIARMKMFAGDPFIRQGELRKTVLELDDSQLIRRLYVDPEERGREEVEDEMIVIPSLLEGIPVPVKPGQDHAARVRALMAFLQDPARQEAPPTPRAMRGIQGRIQAHLQALQQENPQAAAAFSHELAAAAQPQPIAPAPSDVALPA